MSGHACARCGGTATFRSEAILLTRTASYLPLDSLAQWLSVDTCCVWEEMRAVGFVSCVLSNSEKTRRTGDEREVAGRPVPITRRLFLPSQMDVSVARSFLPPLSLVPCFHSTTCAFPRLVWKYKLLGVGAFSLQHSAGGWARNSVTTAPCPPTSLAGLDPRPRPQCSPILQHVARHRCCEYPINARHRRTAGSFSSARPSLCSVSLGKDRIGPDPLGALG